MIKDTIRLDLHKQSTYPVIFAKQYDHLEREITIELYDNGIPYILEGEADKDYIIMLRYTKPDKKQGLLEYEIENSIIHVFLTEQTLCQHGRVICDIGIYRNKMSNGTAADTLLSSSIFYINVAKSAFDEEKAISSNEYLALTQATNECIRATDECRKIVAEYTNTIKPEMQSLISQMEEYLKTQK